MSFNTFGKIFRFTTWGESHGPSIGCVIDGCPPNIPLSERDIQKDMDRRRPGQSKFTTQRKESDKVIILSGVFEGRTTGTPISILINNEDKKSRDYEQLLAAEARQEMDQFKLETTELPCKMKILAQFEIPKSWAKWRQQAAQLGEYTPGRPDIDNVAKSALDAFNGIIYVDDAQVYDLQIKKAYGQPLLIASVFWDE